MCNKLLRGAASAFLLCATLGQDNSPTDTENWWEHNYNTVTHVQCFTTASEKPFTIEVRHEWAPIGAARFVELIELGFLTDIGLFRCVKDFITQFGIPGDPSTREYWRKTLPSIQDDHPNPRIPFKAGMVSFAGGGNNTRGADLFIAFADSKHLGGSPWETPFAQIIEGFEEVVLNFYTGYGEMQPYNKNGPHQHKIQKEGNAYLRREFPLLTYIKECNVIGTPQSPVGQVHGNGAGSFLQNFLFVAGVLLIAAVVALGLKRARKVDRFEE